MRMNRIMELRGTNSNETENIQYNTEGNYSV